jgi:DNA-binding SARP family transcriptional activator
MSASPWRIELFGGLTARHGDRAVSHFETRKIAALLACLSLRLPHPVPRMVLAEQLWPEEDWDATRNRLRQALSSLRRDLELLRPAADAPEAGERDGVLLADRADVRLNAAVVTTDVAEFESALRAAGRAADPPARAAFLREAIALYQGELVPGYYEEWVSAERERLASAYRDALGQLAEALAATGDLPGAITIGRRFAVEDPLREDARCLLMRIYATAGRTAEALREYRDLERLLREELSAVPSPATRSLLEELQSGRVEEGMSGRGKDPAVRPAPAPPRRHSSALSSVPPLEPEGGAVPLGSRFYLERPADGQFHSAIGRRDSIVLVKGPRQIGKTSLLARGLQRAREDGARVVLTDLQKLAPEQLESAASLFRAFAEMISDQLDLDVTPEEVWHPRRGWNVNFERFLRRKVLGGLGKSGGVEERRSGRTEGERRDGSASSLPLFHSSTPPLLPSCGAWMRWTGSSTIRSAMWSSASFAPGTTSAPSTRRVRGAGSPWQSLTRRRRTSSSQT